MRRRAFRRLLDTQGADPSRWPADRHAAAQGLLAIDAEARKALDEAQRLEALLAGFVVPEELCDDRRAVALLSSLPAQRLPLRWLPPLLSRWDFTPAWSRVAALAAVAVLGIMVGMVDPRTTSGPLNEGPGGDLSELVFDSAAGVGIGP
jgi:hypothetical protein